jgi:hypothetical protein
VPRARQLLVALDAALTLRQLKGISLRKPVELPDLPAAYIAEVGHAGRCADKQVASSRSQDMGHYLLKAPEAMLSRGPVVRHASAAPGHLA